MVKQIVKNLLSNYAGTTLGMALGFLLVPFLIRKLGRDVFGVTVLAESLIAFLQIFIFSIRLALSRYATVSVSRANADDVEEYLAAGQRLLLLLMGVVFAAGLVISFYFPLVFKVPVVCFTQSRWLFFLIMSAFVISIPNAVYWSVLYAHQRFDLINLSNFGGVALRAAGIFALFLTLPPAYANLVTYGVIYFGMTWAQNFFIRWWADRIRPGLNLSGRKFHAGKAREILSFSGYSSISTLSTVIYENVMNVLINIYLGPAANTVFAVALRVPVVIKRLLLEPSWATIPTFTDLAARGERGKLQELFFLYSKVISVVAIPVGIVLMVYARPIIRFWVGPGFEEAADAMPYLVAGTVLSMYAYFRAPVINAYGKLKVATVGSLVLAVFNIILGVLLGFVWHEGIIGIAKAVLVTSVLGSLIFCSVHACRVAKMPVWGYWRETLIKPLAAGVIIFGGAFLAGAEMPWQGRAGLLAAAVLVYAAASGRFVFSKHERQYFAANVSAYFAKLAGRPVLAAEDSARDVKGKGG